MAARGPVAPALLHKGDRESLGYLMAQEKLARETEAAAATNTSDIASLDTRVTALENPTAPFESTPQIITPASMLTLPHGLGAMPSSVRSYLTCVTADNGYVENQRIANPHPAIIFTEAGGTLRAIGATVSYDATNVYVTFGSGSGGGADVFLATDSTTSYSSQFLTNANWKLTVVAEP